MSRTKQFIHKVTRLAVATTITFVCCDHLLFTTVNCWSFPRLRGQNQVACTDTANCTALDPHSSCINGRCLCTGNLYRRFTDGCLPAAGGDNLEGDNGGSSSDVFNILIPFLAFLVAAVAVLLFALFRMRLRNSGLERELEDGNQNGQIICNGVVFNGSNHHHHHHHHDDCEEMAKNDLPPSYNEFDFPPPPYEVVVGGSTSVVKVEV